MVWTLDELVTRVAAALSGGYPGAPNGRVRDVPDRRAVRWYATTGLIDRPSAMRGRTALYGPRHLLQLVAVKRRQAQGRTLAQIQAELTGATDQALALVARVPDELLAGIDQPAGAGTVRPRFWTRAPATPDPVAAPASPAPAAPSSPPRTPAPADRGQPGDRPVEATAAADPAARPGARTLASDAAPTQPPQPAPLAGVALGGGVVLLLPGQPGPADHAAIAAAAGPLLDLLAARGLTTGPAPGAHHHRPSAGRADDDPSDRRATRTRRSTP